MKKDIINETAYKTIWCPSCRMEKSLQEGQFSLVVWISPNQVLVCQYCVCQECTTQMFNMKNKKDRQKVSDRCSDALLSRYPQLKHKLPDSYTGPTSLDDY